MVLSNKKLKQKKREENAKNPPIPANLPPKYLSEMSEQLLKEKQSNSKGEKRRRDDVGSVVNGGTLENKKRKKKGTKDEDAGNGGGVVINDVKDLPFNGNKEKKKKKKVKKGTKEEDVGNGGGVVINDVKELPLNGKKEKKKKKKKVKKFKKKKKAEKEGEKKLNDGIGAEVDSQQAVVDGFSGGSVEDTRKVYVGGMPYYSTEGDIQSYFADCGTVTDIDCMTFPETGKFRGIAILTFETKEAAEIALALDGSEMAGLYLTIQPYKATRASKLSNFSPPVVEGYNRIYAGNLSWDISEDDLRSLFSDCNISSIRFGEDKETGEFKGYAHVDFSDGLSLNKALKLDQKFLFGRPVKISRAVPMKGTTRNSGSNSMVVKSGISTGANVTPESTSADHSVVMPAKKTETILPAAPSAHLAHAAIPSPTARAAPSVPEAPVAPPAPVAPLGPVNSTGVSAGKLKRRTCYECGERGHISSDCPKKP